MPLDPPPATTRRERTAASVVWPVAEKEIRDNLYQAKFYLVLGALLLLTVTSTVLMTGDYRIRRANYDLQRTFVDEQVALAPPHPLSILVKGLDDVLGAPYDVGLTNGGVQMGSSQQKTNPLFAVVTTPDLLYVVSIIVSIAALLLTYQLISGDRERGTLKLLLASGAQRGELLLGKWLGAFVSLAVPFLLVSVACILVVSLLPSIEFSRADLGRIALILLLSLLYAAAFTSLGLLVSASARTSSGSMAACLSIWLLLVVVAPRLSPVLAAHLVRVPSPETVDEEISQIRLQHVVDANRKARELPTNASEKDYARLYNAFERRSSEAIFRVEEDYFNRLDDYVGLSQALARISPTAGLTFAATDLAGTGTFDIQRLRSRILAFKREFIERVYANRLASRDQVRPLPRFAPQRPALGEVLATTSLDFLLLLLFTVGTYLGAQVVFSRCDPR